MAGIDLDRMKGDRDARPKPGKGGGGDLFKFGSGRTNVYVAPPTEDMDGLPYVVVEVHYNVTPDGKQMVACLDPHNEVLWHPSTVDALKERGITLPDRKASTCPICEDVATLPKGDAKGKRRRAKGQYLFAIIPMSTGGRRDRKDLPDDKAKPCATLVGYQVWDGICAVIEAEADITNATEAILAAVTKTGEQLDTEYTVAADSDTIREPLRLSKPQRAALRLAQEPGGDCDLFSVLAAFVKPADDVGRLMRGEKLDRKDAPAEDSGLPTCYGYDCDPKDPECVRCPHKVECASECKVAVPGGRGRVASTRDEDEDPPARATRRAPAPVDDDAPAAAARGRSRRAEPEPDEAPPAKGKDAARRRLAADPPDDIPFFMDDEPDAKPGRALVEAPTGPEDDPDPEEADSPPVKAPPVGRRAAAAPAAAAAVDGDAAGDEPNPVDDFEREMRARRSRKAAGK